MTHTAATLSTHSNNGFGINSVGLQSAMFDQNLITPMLNLHRFGRYCSVSRHFWDIEFFERVRYSEFTELKLWHRTHTSGHARNKMIRTMFRVLFENDFDTQTFAHEHVTHLVNKHCWNTCKPYENRESGEISNSRLNKNKMDLQQFLASPPQLPIIRSWNTKK